MARRLCVLAVALVLLVPAVAGAVTVDDLVGLSKAGLADDILTALIDADRSVFQLTPEQIVDLKAAGLSDAVIVKMIGTAREFGANRSVAPRVVVIGEKPATSRRSRAVAVAPVYVPVPVAVIPAFPVVPVVPHHAQRPLSRDVIPAQPAIRAGHFVGEPVRDGAGFGRFINTMPVQPADAAR